MGLRVKVFADGADLTTIRRLSSNPVISGWTTNPTLMKSAGVKDYKAFAQTALALIGGRPISFEVFADDFPTMERQAREIASWGDNIYVKVPVTNTHGVPAAELVSSLSRSGVKLNITAILTLEQVAQIRDALPQRADAIISVFAGRIADTGRDPIPLMASAVSMLRQHPDCKLLWASPREVLNIYQADECGCHIITVTEDQLKKLALARKDLDEYSRETVQMFHRDAQVAGYSL